MSTPLLATKLQVPRLSTSAVSRPRLTDRLVAGLREERRLTVLSAPAGYGKTTLLVEWLPQCGRPCAWLSLDEGDNEPVRFWTYAVAALQAVAPGLGEPVLATLGAPQPPAFEAVLTELINEVAERSEPMLLVLDDYHLIASQAIHDALSFLLQNLPWQMHLAIATRSDPPLPLPMLRAKRQLTELRLADLRFTPQEAASFLRDVVGLELSAEDLNRLETRTEGWIAGLQLAALSMQGRKDLAGFIAAFSGSHRYVLDYLAEEVLNRQPPAVQEFLLQTSILQRLNGSLCDAVTGKSGGQQMLHLLEEANLFIVPLDDERQWYRYHRLFADLLRTRLEDGDASAVAELHRWASQWYEQNGAIHDAVGHAVDAGDWLRLRQLIEMHGMSLLMRGELATLLTWVSQLPEDVVADSRKIGTLHAWALLLTGQMGLLESRLRQVERGLDKAPSDDLGGQVAAIRAYQAAQMGDAARTVQLAQSALGQLAEDNEEIRSVVLFVLGGAHLLSGNVAAAGGAMSEAGAMGRRAGNIHLAVPALNALAGIQLLQGQLTEAWETAQQAVQLATSPTGQVLPIAGGALSSLAELAYEWDEVEEALDYARQGIKLGERWGNQDTVISGYLTLAQVLEGMGEIREAAEAIEYAERLSRSAVTVPTLKAVLRGAQGRLWLAMNRLPAAQRWADGTPTEPIHPMRVPELLTLARVRVTLADLGAADALLDQLLHMGRAQGLQAVLIEALTLRALSYAAVEDESSALQVLAEALQLGEVEGFMRRFVDLGAPLVPLLRLAASHGVSVPYVGRLLAAFARPAGPTAQQALLEPLSDRELEVLGLIAQGLSNRQIAEQLFITVSTVKSHANHIFGKLAAKSRTEAVARARDLGLF